MEPRFSVIIALYQAQPYIEQCLESLKAQSFGDFEALVVDDGSRDDGYAVAQAYASGDSRFRFFQLPENRGQSASRNLALDNAQGQILVLLDSDDYLTPDALEKIHHRFKRQNLDDLYFNAHSFYEDDKAYSCIVEDFEGRKPYESVLDGPALFAWFEQRDQFFPHGALRAVRRDLVERQGIRFAEGIIHEDLLFTLQTLVASKRSSFLHDQVYQRRIHAGSTMAKPRRTMRNIEGHLVSIQWLRDYCRNNADQLDSAFLDAAALRINSYLDLCAKDWMRDITNQEQADYLAKLSPSQRFRFQEDVAQRAKHWQDIYDSRSWRIGQAVVKGPRTVIDTVQRISRMKGQRG